MIRDNIWLLSRLDYVWSSFFADVPQNNRIYIKFGRFSKLRLGSIKMNPTTKSSFITITAMFKDPSVPVEVIDHTIGHELSHYSHGFSSPHRRLHRYPHEGGVVRREMTSRGMGYLHKEYNKWVRAYRKQLMKQW